MTKKEKLLPIIGIILAPVLATVTTILRAGSLFTEYDKTSGYFSSPALLNTAFLWVCTLALALFLAFAILGRRYFPAPTYRSSLSVLFSSAFLIVTLAVATLLALFSLSSVTSNLTKSFWIIAAISALISLFYFIPFFVKEEARGNAQGLLGLAPAFFCLFTAMLFYFDRTLQMNDPAKMLHMLAFVVLAAYFTAEARGILAEAKRPFCYLLSASAMLLSLSASVPNLLYNLIEGKALVLTSVYDFLLLGATLYTLSRLLQMMPYEYPSVHGMVQALLHRAQEEAAAEEAVPETPAPAMEVEELLAAAAIEPQDDQTPTENT